MVNKIISISKEELNNIDFSKYKDSTDKFGSPKGWFYMDAGYEHYRLLAYISGLFKKQTLLDIGTYQGSSSIALSFNKNNKVISFDLDPQPEIENIKIPNIEFRLGNILNDDSLILSVPFILVDTYHNGDFELDFINKLIEIKYKGLVMFDDIHLNDPMRKFWNSIKQEKYDLTSIGHQTGTGLIKF